MRRSIAIVTPSKYLMALPNIGKALAIKLRLAGIETPDQLEQIGSRDAFIRLRVLDPDACIQTLYALEGAIQGVRWHNLDHSVKRELRDFFRLIEDQGR